MENIKTAFKKFKKGIRWFDFSGESFTFKYKDKDKLSTISAGIIYFIFFVLALTYFISILKPFLKHKIFDLQYYVINTDQNEIVIFREKTPAFAFGLKNVSNNSKYNINDINDLFTLEAKFTYKVDGDDNNNETHKIVPTKCRKEYFNDITSNSALLEDIGQLKCFDEKDFINNPSGIFTDHIFSYYTITVKSKYQKNKTHDSIIDDYLTTNDCKLQFYYKDISLNLNDYDEPFSYIINSMFLQLNPSLFQKRNIFYMNYHLEDNSKIIQLDIKDQDPEIETGISRVEDYAEYKGVNRTINGYGNEINYAKIYIRADNRKIMIKRKYQDLLEFYPDKSSLWLSVYWILGFFFALYDRENANHSISKRLFYFEGIKDNKFNKFKELKELIENIQESENNNQNEENKVSPYTTRNDPTSKTLRNNYMRRNTNSTLKTDLDKNEKDKNIKEINYESYNLF